MLYCLMCISYPRVSAYAIMCLQAWLLPKIMSLKKVFFNKIFDFGSFMITNIISRKAKICLGFSNSWI